MIKVQLVFVNGPLRTVSFPENTYDIEQYGYLALQIAEEFGQLNGKPISIYVRGEDFIHAYRVIDDEDFWMLIPETEPYQPTNRIAHLFKEGQA